MAALYAANTTVSVEKSRAEVEAILARYGADQFAYATEPGKAAIMFQIQDKATKTTLAIRMVLPLPAKGEKRFTTGWNRCSWAAAPDHAVQERWEQACRTCWRSLLLIIKAKLEACAAGISTVEREFLADVVTPNGQTIGEQIRPQLQDMSDAGQTPRLMLTAGGGM